MPRLDARGRRTPWYPSLHATGTNWSTQSRSSPHSLKDARADFETQPVPAPVISCIGLSNPTTCHRYPDSKNNSLRTMTGAHLACPFRGELGYAHWPQLGTKFGVRYANKMLIIKVTNCVQQFGKL